MDVATSFDALLQVVAVVMTKPSANTFRTLVTGWVLAPRRTIMDMVRACGTDRHHAAFHRLFATACWSVDQAGLAVFDLITQGRQAVFLTVDDTLLQRFGLNIFGTGMHRDPVLSSRGHTVTRWGHCWVVLCVVIESQHVPDRRFSLPVLARLYLNKASAQKWSRVYRKKTDLMIEMVGVLDRHVADGEKRLHLLGDSTFTAPALVAQLPSSMHVTGRVVNDARIHAAPSKRQPGQVGRPRIRGERLPNPQQMLQQKGLRRLTLKLYERSTYRVRVATQIGRFYKSPQREVLVIAVEHLRGGRGVEVFSTTDLEADVETVLNRYSWRWSIEVTFHDTKTHLGMTEPQNRTTLAARRTAAMGFLLYSLIIWWHETARNEPAKPLRNWPGKQAASFADMLAALRLETLQSCSEAYFSTPTIPRGVKKLIHHLTNLVSLSA